MLKIRALSHSTADADPANPPAAPLARWQQLLKDAIRDPLELCRLLELPEEFHSPAVAAARLFPLRAPRGFVSRMRRRDPHDPLLRQVLPLGEELTPDPAFRQDPVGDRAAEIAPGVLQKYNGRVLLVTTGCCAIHCRYCFRRHYPYHESPHGVTAWEPALEKLAADPSLEEVLLSGGDPWTLSDATLAALVQRLAAIPQLQRVRFHTRLPIVLPERVTRGLIDAISGTRLTPIVVVHANHAQELDASVAAACQQLLHAGVVLLNQTVLLRGVNDDAGVLADLSRRLIACRVTPYYLHQLDRVQGAAHFEVPVARGLELLAELRRSLPGYLAPRYVAEIEGEASKTPLE